MAASLNNVEYTGDDQRFMREVVAEITRLNRLVQSQATLIAALDKRTR